MGKTKRKQSSLRFRKGDRVKVLYSGKYLSAVVTAMSKRGKMTRLHVKYSKDGSFETIEKDENIADRVTLDTVKKRNASSVNVTTSITPAKKKKKIAQTTTALPPMRRVRKLRKKLTSHKKIGREGIGFGVYVYWDLDETWYFGRIEKYRVEIDTGRELHQIVYSDGDVEWICLPEVRFYYSDTVGWAKLGRCPTCPAEIFQVASGFEEDKRFVNRNQRFAYFWNPGKKGGRSFAWVSCKSVQALSEVKPRKQYLNAFESAMKEQNIRASMHVASIRGPELVGYEMNFRHDKIFPTASSGSKVIRGTMTAYDSIGGLNFVVFKDIDIVPRWIDLETIKPQKVFVERQNLGENAVENSCQLCFRSSTCYDSRTTTTGRNVGCDTKCVMLTCASCSKTFHSICCSVSMKSTMMTAAATSTIIASCHECRRCDGCDKKAVDLKCEFTQNHTFKRAEILESELSRFLPSIPNLNLCVKCVKSFDSGEFCATCYKSWDFDEGEDREYRKCEAQMIQCDYCVSWNHAICDPCVATLQDYQNLMKKNDKYFCPLCRYAAFSRALKSLYECDFRGMFRDPVTEAIAPGYFTVIDRPMSLKTMHDKVKSMTYANPSEFRSDFALICFNAATYVYS